MERVGLVSRPDQYPSFDQCDFYHVMSLEDVTTRGQWDLRGTVDEYLGHFSFAGKRVLEIGPASGFLTFEMEKRGAEVLAIEVTDEPGWDYVPYPAEALRHRFEARAGHMARIKNSFWYGHRATGSRARVYYGDVYQLPPELGHFDVAVTAAVLLHCRWPLQVIEQCVAKSDAIIIVDLFDESLEGRPVCQLQPNATNMSYDTWWSFSTDLLREWLGVLGLHVDSLTTHSQSFTGDPANPRPMKFFTIVASK
jgi:O-methyltransferase